MSEFRAVPLTGSDLARLIGGGSEHRARQAIPEAQAYELLQRYAVLLSQLARPLDWVMPGDVLVPHPQLRLISGEQEEAQGQFLICFLRWLDLDSREDQLLLEDILHQSNNRIGPLDMVGFCINSETGLAHKTAESSAHFVLWEGDYSE